MTNLTTATRIEIRNAEYGTVHHVSPHSRGIFACSFDTTAKVYVSEGTARAAFTRSNLRGVYRSVCGTASTVHYVSVVS